MNHEQTLKLAGKSEPEMMLKTAAILKSLEETDIEAFQEVVEEIAGFTSLVKTKTASAGNLGLAMTGAALAALGSAVATDAYDAARRGLTKSRNYKRLLEHNPDIRERYPTEEIRKTFDTLHRFSPDFTNDPLVGGTVLKRLLEFPQESERVVRDLIASRKNLVESKGKYFHPMASAGPSLLRDGRRE
jgi:hypothetical protein